MLFRMYRDEKKRWIMLALAALYVLQLLPIVSHAAGVVTYSIERQYHAPKGGTCYYDRVILQGNSVAIQKINEDLDRRLSDVIRRYDEYMKDPLYGIANLPPTPRELKEIRFTKNINHDPVPVYSRGERVYDDDVGIFYENGIFSICANRIVWTGGGVAKSCTEAYAYSLATGDRLNIYQLTNMDRASINTILKNKLEYMPLDLTSTSVGCCVKNGTIHVVPNMTFDSMGSDNALIDTGIPAITIEVPLFDEPNYNSFPRIFEVKKGDTAVLPDGLPAFLNGNLGTEEWSVYQLDEGLFYAICKNQAILVKQIITEGKAGFRIVQADAAPRAEGELQAAVTNDRATPNIQLDYAAAGKDKLQYLKASLKNIDGITVNDSAKNSTADYIQTAIAEQGTLVIQSKKNSATINQRTLKGASRSLQKQYQDYLAALGDTTLNKQILQIQRIFMQDMSCEQGAQITIDANTLESLGGIDRLQLLLGDVQHSVTLSAEALRNILKAHGEITIQLTKTAENTYTIQFVDSRGQALPKLADTLFFSLPASSEFSGLLVNYAEGADQWGGQYDATTQSISFGTPYSGSYEVTENNVQIADIAALSEQQQRAIRYMVSRGYFALDENGNFVPNGELNRYAFSEALVRMFYALDRTQKTTFSDVAEDNPYYPFVASGEQGKIINGFEDGTFRGDNGVLREQAIALAARTLMDKKGYTAPENTEKLLNFSDKGEISEWAQPAVALAARELLIAPVGTVQPTRVISRAEAAELLYRLFMLLYEPPQAAPVTTGTMVDTGLPIAPIAGVGLVLVGLAAFGYAIVQYEKQKKTKS